MEMTEKNTGLESQEGRRTQANDLGCGQNILIAFIVCCR